MPRLSIALAAILWGTTGTAQALASTQAHPLAVGALRLLIGTACLLALAVAADRPGLTRPWPRRATILAGLGVALYQVSFFAAVKTMGVAAGTVTAIGSAPVAAGILGFLVHGERPAWPWYPATALAIAGCALLSTSMGGAFSWVGLPLALGAGCSYALYSAYCKTIVRERRPETAMAGVFGLAALILAPLCAILDMTWLTEPRSIAAMVHLGVFATALAYVLFSRGLAHTPVATAVTISLLEPLTATALGVFLLREPLSTGQISGMASILAGMVLLSFERAAPLPTTSSRTIVDSKSPNTHGGRP